MFCHRLCIGLRHRLCHFLLRNVLLLVVLLEIYPSRPPRRIHENPSLPIFSRVFFTSRFPGAGVIAASLSLCCTLFAKVSLRLKQTSCSAHRSRFDLLRPLCRFLLLFLLFFHRLLWLLWNTLWSVLLVRIRIGGKLANAIPLLLLSPRHKGYSNHVLFLEQVRVVLRLGEGRLRNGLLLHGGLLRRRLGEESLQRALRRRGLHRVLLGGSGGAVRSTSNPQRDPYRISGSSKVRTADVITVILGHFTWEGLQVRNTVKDHSGWSALQF